MNRHEYSAHAAMRDAAMIEPRLASVRAMQAIRTQQRARAERRARIACLVIMVAVPLLIFIVATGA